MRLILLALILLSTSACSIPLVGSLAGNGATAYATKKVEHGLARSVIDVAMPKAGWSMKAAPER